MGRERDYLYRRGDVWWLRLQFPPDFGPDLGGREIRRSLGTRVRAEAEIIASQEINAHRMLLMMKRAARQGTLNAKRGLKLPVGMGVDDDGERYFATADTVHYVGDDGAVVRTTPNQALTWTVRPQTVEERKAADAIGRRSVSSRDDQIIETWIKQRGITGFLEREARTVWGLFREITDKPLAKCDRDDGRKLVTKLLESGNSYPTVQKKVGHLCAAVNVAIDEGKLKFNPFSRIVPEFAESERRLPLSASDMKLCIENIETLSSEDQLLFQILARTGMRLSEPFEIDEEFEEDGIRYVIIGSKTPQSRRRVPLPDAVLSLLPARITGPLFTDTAKTSGKRLMRFLRGLDIAWDEKRETGDARKVVHSLRHRAIDRLRAVRCPREIRLAITGHDRKTVHDGYGEGPPVSELSEWVERIGV